MRSRMFVTLNARLQPLDRGDRYRDPLAAALGRELPGCEVTGGGTLLTVDREPSVSDLDLDIEGDPQAAIDLTIRTLEAAGAPKGSHMRVDDGEQIPFGTTEGVAVYLNGTDLPDEVYETSDINELIARLLDRLGADGHMQSYWQGPTETALYLYGPSGERIRELIADVLAGFPLAQRCRVVSLDLTPPSRG